MLKSLIRRQILFTAITFTVVLMGTQFLTQEIMRRNRADILQHQIEVFEYLIENSKKDAVTSAHELNEINERTGAPFRVDLVRNGKSLLTGDNFQSLETRPPEVGGPRGHERAVDLAGHDGVKLVARLGPPSDGNTRHFMTFVIFLAIVVASCLSVFLFFWRYRGKAELAKSVLGRIQQGDLKARFPMSKWDDAGQILQLFNEMADEIERLVERLRANEKARMHLLQDLAHDLRTPMASLRTIIEGLNMDEGDLERADRKEMTELAYQETEYLTRLVEDLLFLALVIEPKYKEQTDEVPVEETIAAQLAAGAVNHPQVRVRPVISANPNVVAGNRHLLTRLLRNIIENAFSFAKSSVEARVESTAGTVEIVVTDDGPGFSHEALESYGKKRATRYLSAQNSARISVGLGSVIAHAIVGAHGGEIRARNSPGGGAEVRIILPRISN